MLVARLVAILIAAGWGSQLVEAGLGLDRWSAALYAPLVVMVLAAPAVLVLVLAPGRRLLREAKRASTQREDKLRAEAERQEFDGTLRRAFELAHDEGAALDVVARAGRLVSPEASVELLLADSSEAHLRRAVRSAGMEGEGCQVPDPWSCPAMAAGRTRTFGSSEDLDTCPHLRNRPAGDRSALCVPVTFLGRALGVLHRVAEPRVAPSEETVQRLRLLGGQTGATLGMLRALARSQVQANTDALTGLLNRRSVQDGVRLLDGKAYAVLMADLDLFKQLNDVHGHDSGDRALRLFSQVLRDSVRDGDLVGRYGGEEFLVVLRGLDAAAGARVAARIRAGLERALASGGSPVFTTSIGVADSTSGGEFDEVVKAADAALFDAKSQGRDRVSLAGGPILPAQREPVEVPG